MDLTNLFLNFERKNNFLQKVEQFMQIKQEYVNIMQKFCQQKETVRSCLVVMRLFMTTGNDLNFEDMGICICTFNL